MNSWNSLRLYYSPPGGQSIRIATVVYSEDRTEVHWRFIDEWQRLIREEDREVFFDLEDEFARMFSEMKGPAFIKWMEETLSNTLLADGPFVLTDCDDLNLFNSQEL